MSVFDATDYKEYLKKWVDDRPGGGRGEYRKMATALNVSTTLISQVVNGDKHFSMELANELCDYLAFGEKEADYFLLLVEYGRAGSHGYRQRLKKRIDTARNLAQKLSERMQKDRDLSEAEAAAYYSHWAYTGITHLAACDPRLDVEVLTQRLKLPKRSVAKIMDFLLRSGILVNNGGNIEVGVKMTHTGADSPHIVKHHQNWRLQGFNRMNFAADEDLFYTSPMSLSHETAAVIRGEIPTFLEKLAKLVGPSPSETVRCINIDWFGY